MTTIVFDKDKTKIVKGFAILFMMLLHCLASPEWYDVQFEAFENPLVCKVFSTFKMCVAMFTFMVGFGYAFSKRKDLNYSWEHICRLLLPFWIVIFVFTVPFCRDIDGWVLVKNMIGVNSSLNYFSWFVYFFIYAMVVMPVIARIVDKKVWCAIVVVGCSYLCGIAIHSLPNWSEHNFITAAFNCMMQTPCMVVGYLFAKYRIFEKVRLPKSNFVLRYHKSSILGFNLGLVYAPMIIFAIVTMFSRWQSKTVSTIFMTLGELSVYMWFLHALFFTKAVREMYQPIILISDNVFVVALWTILLTAVSAWILNRIVVGFQRIVK